MTGNENHRETGATEYPAQTGTDASKNFSQDAAGKRPPAGGQGLTKPPGGAEDEPHQSDGRNTPRRATPSPATQKTSGAGPAISEHSKDAKAPKAGRQPGAYRKD
jgi:hypothetical protein